VVGHGHASHLPADGRWPGRVVAWRDERQRACTRSARSRDPEKGALPLDQHAIALRAAVWPGLEQPVLALDNDAPDALPPRSTSAATRCATTARALQQVPALGGCA
jgi:hypothetical protein